ncbi:MAG TPA: urate hydroxylase PuuD [Candidatus Thermoplasmatota archaeon]|nr:urate hydroxylase PuuD [Candidatus Thermoplasmatota archaeon]
MVSPYVTDNDAALRFLHVLSGIVWIGMLYFFNLVNLPLLKFQMRKPYDANMAEKATAHITIKTLFWFRWGAASTVLFGLILLYGHMEGYRAGLEAGGVLAYHVYAIYLGALLALVMAFNVWFVIWPRQQKILGNNKAIAATADEAEKKRLGEANAPLVKTAVMASRVNTWLSIPMLWGMVFGAHGDAFTTARQWALPVVLLVVLLLVAAMYSQAKKPKAA